MQITFNVFLCLLDHVVTMPLLAGKYYERRLALPVDLNLKYFGTINSSWPVEIFFYQVDGHVQKRIGAAIGIDPIFIRDQFIRLQVHLWEHRSESIRSSPMRRATF